MAKNIPRLYVVSDLSADALIRLSPEQSHYLKKVMRCREDEAVLLFNGRDGEWSATIQKLDKVTTLEITHQERTQSYLPKRALWFPPIKHQNLRFMIEKATELGATELHPILTQRTNARHFNADKIHAYTSEAAEQCGRIDIPTLMPLASLDQKLSELEENAFILYGNETLRKEDHKAPNQEASTFLVGPEGGFSAEELQALQKHTQCQEVSLGPLILRTETAALKGLILLDL